MIKDRFGKYIDKGDKIYFTRYNSHWIDMGIIDKIDKNIHITDQVDGSKCRMHLEYSEMRIVKI